MASGRGRCGLCYGPSLAFVIWGLLNNLFLVPERLCLTAVLVRGGRVVQNVDVLPVVLSRDRDVLATPRRAPP